MKLRDFRNCPVRAFENKENKTWICAVKGSNGYLKKEYSMKFFAEGAATEIYKRIKLGQMGEWIVQNQGYTFHNYDDEGGI